MSTTPPPPVSHSLQPTGTPIHTRSGTTHRYDSRYENRFTVLTRLANEMGPFVVGPIAPEVFLDLFLPPPPPPPPPTGSSVPSGMFDRYFEVLDENETRWYNVFIEIISPLVKKLALVNTSNAKKEQPSNKFPFDMVPDCSVYMDKKGKKLDFSCLDFIIEFKRLDPFCEPVAVNDPGSSANNPDAAKNPFLCSNSDKRVILGQLTAYASMILSSQYRTHVFMVLIVKKYARLIRWDRGGAVVTGPIPFADQPHLHDFLIRYDIADPEARGHDSTVGLPTNDEITCAKASVPELSGAKSFLAVTISDHQSSNRYIISSPESRPLIPVGRWTRPSVAFDTQNRRRVLLKDSWRVLLDDIKPEGEIYRLLHENSVPNIPSCLVAGDVGNDAYHRSQTHEVMDKHVARHPCWTLTPHRHYRIVLGLVGRRLEKFDRTFEVVNAMSAALVAHEAAFKIGILHRDISVGNILIVGPKELDDSEDPHKSEINGGMLIDWDLSSIVGNTTARQHTRTGTWQFMAADLVERPHTIHKFVHDLESFFWVLLWIVLTQVETTWNDEERSSYIKGTMSPKIYSNSGGRFKIQFLTSQDDLDSRRFEIPGNNILPRLLRGLRKVVAIRHTLPPAPSTNESLDPTTIAGGTNVSVTNLSEAKKQYDRDMTWLDNHSMMITQFKNAINEPDWPTDDGAKNLRVLTSNSVVGVSISGSKRSRTMAEENGVFNEPSSSKRQG